MRGRFKTNRGLYMVLPTRRKIRSLTDIGFTCLFVCDLVDAAALGSTNYSFDHLLGWAPYKQFPNQLGDYVAVMHPNIHRLKYADVFLIWLRYINRIKEFFF
jgi:hypothetical protein